MRISQGLVSFMSRSLEQTTRPGSRLSTSVPLPIIQTTRTIFTCPLSPSAHSFSARASERPWSAIAWPHSTARACPPIWRRAIATAQGFTSALATSGSTGRPTCRVARACTPCGVILPSRGSVRLPEPRLAGLARSADQHGNPVQDALQAELEEPVEIERAGMTEPCVNRERLPATTTRSPAGRSGRRTCNVCAPRPRQGRPSRSASRSSASQRSGRCRSTGAFRSSPAVRRVPH